MSHKLQELVDNLRARDDMTNHEPAIKQVTAGVGRSTMYLESNV